MLFFKSPGYNVKKSSKQIWWDHLFDMNVKKWKALLENYLTENGSKISEEE